MPLPPNDPLRPKRAPTGSRSRNFLLSWPESGYGEPNQQLRRIRRRNEAEMDGTERKFAAHRLNVPELPGAVRHARRA